MAQTSHSIKTATTINNTLIETFQRQNHCLTNVKLLCRLTKAVQQHRGATMAYLSGEPSFLILIDKLQRNIETMLTILNQLNGEKYSCLPPYTSHTINDNWITILMGWKKDRVLRNFEFHCHLVDNLNNLLRHCMKEQLLPSFKSSGKDYQTLLETLLVHIPKNIESLAMLRGLSTNAAVINTCGNESHTKINYLLKKIHSQSTQLNQLLLQCFPELNTVRNQKKTLYKLLLTIKISILDSSEITTDSTNLFQLSTEIIDAHWLSIAEGIQRIEKLIYEILTES